MMPCMTTNSSKRWALTAGAVGLVAGLALGATGLASAVTPSPPSDKGERVMRGHLPPGVKKLIRAHRGAAGLVTGISASSISLRTPFGAKTFDLNGSTEFFEGKTKATRSAVQVGEVVRVVLEDPEASEKLASTVIVLPAHLGGYVTAVDGSTVTLTDRSGFTRKLTTNSTTKVTKDGEDATLAAITVGSFLRATGKVASDGTTLEASRVSVGVPAKGKLGKVLREKRSVDGPPPMGLDLEDDLGFELPGDHPEA
jgi:hypothetical protein